MRVGLVNASFCMDRVVCGGCLAVYFCFLVKVYGTCVCVCVICDWSDVLGMCQTCRKKKRPHTSHMCTIQTPIILPLSVSVCIFRRAHF